MKFEEPKMDIIEFSLYDVIATSILDDGPVLEENSPSFESQVDIMFA